jgi:hypothetical protein
MEEVLSELETALAALRKQGVSLSKKEKGQMATAVRRDLDEEIRERPETKKGIFKKIGDWLKSPLGKTLVNMVPTILAML